VNYGSHLQLEYSFGVVAVARIRRGARQEQRARRLGDGRRFAVSRRQRIVTSAKSIKITRAITLDGSNGDGGSSLPTTGKLTNLKTLSADILEDSSTHGALITFLCAWR
jgi:hypothetical protein